MKKPHVIPAYFLSPPHQITINVIGIGGTGSKLVVELVKLNMALQGLGHPGINVTAWDNDKVEQSNVARQMFYEQDIGNYKSIALIEKINRSYGLNWNAKPVMFRTSFSKTRNQKRHPEALSNIYISCVDSINSRKAIAKFCNNIKRSINLFDESKPYYWMDLGNDYDFGQVVLGTIYSAKYVDKLITVDKIFDFNNIDETDTEPSCSLAVALGRQDLYINGFIALYAVNMLWKLFRFGMIDYNIVYVNLKNMQIAKSFKKY